MSRSTAAALILGLVLVADVAVLTLTAATPPAGGRLGITDLFFAASFIPFAAVGALIVSRTGSAVGWLFLGAASAHSGGLLLRALGILLLETVPVTGPAGLYLAWPSLLLSPLALALVLVFWLPLIFPDGRLPSARWRVPALVAAATILTQNVLQALEPGPMYTAGERSNPFGVEGLGGIADLGFFLVVAVLGIPVWALISRWKRSSGPERQQLKWVSYTSFVLTALFAGIALSGFYELALLIAIAFAALPFSVAIAILRYRLYDIDVLINRTLVYGALSAGLVATYFGVVVLFQSVLRPFTAGSELAVAGSTLATLALVQPLRRRIQDAVDRRFSRSRYDAARTLDAFSVRLRDEVDLDAVRADLLGAVRDTVQPAHASVWLRARAR